MGTVIALQAVKAATHTRGPWAVDRTEWPLTIVEPGGRRRTIATPYYENNDGWVAEDISADECLANANLIAAAPDLLEVARRLRKLVIAYSELAEDDDDWGPAEQQTLETANAVIARAEGSA